MFSIVRPNFRNFLTLSLSLALIVLLNSAFVSAQITIPAAGTTSGRANPYPAVFNVSGRTGVVSKVTVSITGFTHAFPDDVDIMLVSPDGRNAIILSDVGGDNLTPVNNVNLVLDDAAPVSLPDNGQITSTTYKPTNVASPDDAGGIDNFPAALGANPSPPATSANTALSTFNGSTPNGDWRLYVVDDGVGDNGSIAGFSLTITTAAAPTAATGNLSGQALTPSGEAISGARVTAFDTTTQEYFSAVTDISGDFNLTDLQVGHFFIITISHKRYSFGSYTQGLQLFNDEILSFVGQSSKARVRMF
jgi:subtilisin-like proprotein convertase family protein